MNKIIKDIIDKLGGCKEHLSTNDLVEIGLFPSIQAIHQARVRKDTPHFTIVGRNAIYSKKDILNYIETKHDTILKRYLRKGSAMNVKNHKNKTESLYSKRLKQHLIDVIITALKECDV